MSARQVLRRSARCGAESSEQELVVDALEGRVLSGSLAARESLDTLFASWEGRRCVWVIALRRSALRSLRKSSSRSGCFTSLTISCYVSSMIPPRRLPRKGLALAPLELPRPPSRFHSLLPRYACSRPRSLGVRPYFHLWRRSR